MPVVRLSLSDFDYSLPKEFIAQHPQRRRDASRLLVLERPGGRISHRRFRDIAEYFSPGDCLILNNTKVVWARLIGHRERLNASCGGGRQELFLMRKLGPDTFAVLARPAKKLAIGNKILFAGGNAYALVVKDLGMQKVVRFYGAGGARGIWQRFGQVPLPPYIKRAPLEIDKERYQTVYAQKEGATAAPTAGLHFTKELLKELQGRGAEIAYLTLHVNYGTFAPVESEDISLHKMHKEYFVLPKQAKDAVEAARSKGKKVFAVGTTSVRVLETSAGAEGIKPGRGWTDLFIYPPYNFKVVNCLITNFHFPKSTLLMLVSAFAGKELLFQAYREAIKEKYRFFSYGDAMLIL